MHGECFGSVQECLRFGAKLPLPQRFSANAALPRCTFYISSFPHDEMFLQWSTGIVLRHDVSAQSVLVELSDAAAAGAGSGASSPTEKASSDFRAGRRHTHRRQRKRARTLSIAEQFVVPLGSVEYWYPGVRPVLVTDPFAFSKSAPGTLTKSKSVSTPGASSTTHDPLSCLRSSPGGASDDDVSLLLPPGGAPAHESEPLAQGGATPHASPAHAPPTARTAPAVSHLSDSDAGGSDPEDSDGSEDSGSDDEGGVGGAKLTTHGSMDSDTSFCLHEGCDNGPFTISLQPYVPSDPLSGCGLTQQGTAEHGGAGGFDGKLAACSITVQGLSDSTSSKRCTPSPGIALRGPSPQYGGGDSIRCMSPPDAAPPAGAPGTPLASNPTSAGSTSGSSESGGPLDALRPPPSTIKAHRSESVASSVRSEELPAEAGTFVGALWHSVSSLAGHLVAVRRLHLDSSALLRKTAPVTGVLGHDHAGLKPLKAASGAADAGSEEAPSEGGQGGAASGGAGSQKRTREGGSISPAATRAALLRRLQDRRAMARALSMLSRTLAAGQRVVGRGGGDPVVLPAVSRDLAPAIAAMVRAARGGMAASAPVARSLMANGAALLQRVAAATAASEALLVATQAWREGTPARQRAAVALSVPREVFAGLTVLQLLKLCRAGDVTPVQLWRSAEYVCNPQQRVQGGGLMASAPSSPKAGSVSGPGGAGADTRQGGMANPCMRAAATLASQVVSDLAAGSQGALTPPAPPAAGAHVWRTAVDGDPVDGASEVAAGSVHAAATRGTAAQQASAAGASEVWSSAGAAQDVLGCVLSALAWVVTSVPPEMLDAALNHVQGGNTAAAVPALLDVNAVLRAEAPVKPSDAAKRENMLGVQHSGVLAVSLGGEGGGLLSLPDVMQDFQDPVASRRPAGVGMLVPPASAMVQVDDGPEGGLSGVSGGGEDPFGPSPMKAQLGSPRVKRCSTAVSSASAVVGGGACLTKRPRLGSVGSEGLSPALRGLAAPDGGLLRAAAFLDSPLGASMGMPEGDSGSEEWGDLDSLLGMGDVSDAGGVWRD